MQRMIIQSACFHQWVNFCYSPLICLWGVNSCTIIVVLWRNASYIDRAAALHYAVPFPISLLIWFQIITQPPQHEKESFIGGRQKWAYIINVINNPISCRCVVLLWASWTPVIIGGPGYQGEDLLVQVTGTQFLYVSESGWLCMDPIVWQEFDNFS